MILASLPFPPQDFFLNLIWGLVGLLSIAGLVKNVFFKKIPQPLVTSKAQRMATFEELESVRKEGAENRKLILEMERGWRDRMEELVKDLGDAGEKRAVLIHNRINDVLKEVSHLGGIVEVVLKGKK